MVVTPRIEVAHAKALERLLVAHGSVREAFDLLDTGVTFEDLIAYIERDVHARLIQGAADDLDRLHGRLVGMVAAAALTIVESDRARR